ncbi:putative aldo-keto reductase [Talaromyces proteolyticus]|uniref:Aldo-keto reductase n=1 Tax=Talaromyces proteolyticus TaxID=1131652 RepID=A0AAD4KWW1_9EURO|nr:putative aldo-keto reductase [Talaromyces proteolyticus]KAH8697794.1 putative aldo-keto reductase [Talaromyces proteolyticus]
MAKVSRFAKMSSGLLPLRPPGLARDAPVTTMPTLIYGTAWKKDRTAELVYTALKAGFRAVDTAAQPKHYREDLVGDGVRRALEEGIAKREELYIQSKFTSVQGQDPKNMPYSANMNISDQVHTSIKSSLHNFKTSSSSDSDYIDTLVFHSPLPTIEQTIQAWKTAESYVLNGQIRNLGISNCSISVLEALYKSPEVTVKPAVVQNRFYQDTGFDVELRAFARDHDIIYQSFWTLTANPFLLESDPVEKLSSTAGIGLAPALYALVLSLGKTSILDGTTKEQHMADDLAALSVVDEFAAQHPGEWTAVVDGFKRLIGEKG